MNEAKAFIGREEVLVRFEFEPECPGHGAHPDEPAYVLIEEVRIGGVWIGAQHFNADWLSENEQAILSERRKALQDAAEERAWERSEEALAERGYP